MVDSDGVSAFGRVFVLLLILAGSASSRTLDLQHSDVLVPSKSKLDLPLPRNDSNGLVTAASDVPIQLRLCECERATGAPDGLSCDKEGWFISSWERQGQWVAGGGYVPLSHAICCRPCLPEELPPDSSGRIPGGQAPVAVISLGCHASTDRSLSTRCEPGANSFVAGYSEAVKVFTTPDTFYPINTVQCCTPALLLANGDAWELERIGCHDSNADFPVNCGGTDTDELLLGYIFYRLSPLGHVVPVGPAQCCKLGLSGTVHPMNQCDDLNSCSGRGVCNMRRCECFDGWTGPDCGQAARSGKGIPPWAIALIVLSSSALAGIFIIAAGYALQALGLAPGTPAASEDGDGDERQPLLLRLDPDDSGSVGSADTTDCEDEVAAEEVERRVTQAIERLENAVATAEGQQAAGQPHGDQEAAPEGEQQSMPTPLHSVPATPAPQTTPDHPRAANTGNAQEPPAAPAHAASEEAEAAAAGVQSAIPQGNPTTADIPEPQKHSQGGATPEGPLSMVDCSVCMIRPVQVVVVPCGHVCMCRRCSRRLNRCPICRKEVARRQRLFV